MRHEHCTVMLLLSLPLKAVKLDARTNGFGKHADL